MANPTSMTINYKDDYVRRGEMPSSNGHASARGMAKIASIMA